ncbi:hypothetical protein MHU86_14098 [Fragilaria crotonensis]|nr:hypothetical protein MHU86_14098 [Fragilaria crotonensis]
MAETYQQLKSYDILRHYLEPSIRALKNFARTQGDKSWAESLLRLTYVGEPFPYLVVALRNSSVLIFGNLVTVCQPPVSVSLKCMWNSLPVGRIRSVVNSRRKDIRLGDALYGGAVPSKQLGNNGRGGLFSATERLALRCSFLKFLDPDVITKEDGTEDLQPSNRWNEYRLEDSWWTPFLEKYTMDSVQEMLPQTWKTLPQAIYGALQRRNHVRSATVPGSTDTRHKQSSGVWGPYHANVAEDLVRRLEAMKYNVEVTGGRIEYDDVNKCANVYGFSYGFGRGDHAHSIRHFATPMYLQPTTTQNSCIDSSMWLRGYPDVPNLQVFNDLWDLRSIS